MVSRSAAGGDLRQAWGGEPNGVPVLGRVGDALDGVDVLVNYTSHDAVPDRLVIRHDADFTATPYVAGTLLAVRRVTGRTGLVRGLDTLLLDGHS